MVSYRSNHQGAKNIPVKNGDEEGDKNFIKTKKVREDQENNEDTMNSGMLQGLLWNPIAILTFRDFPGGPGVKNPSSNAGDAGSIPGRGTSTPHAVGELVPHMLQGN